MDYNVEGRSTGRGAFTDASVVVENKVLQASHEEFSRTGNHWERVWYELPTGAAIYFVDVTNSGKEYRSIEAIEDGQDEPVVRAWWEKGRWNGDFAKEAPELWEQFKP